MSATPTISDFVAAIKTQLEAIPDIGFVHDRPRFTVNQKTYADLFIKPGIDQIRAWIIDVPTSDGEEDPAGFLFLTRRGFAITGYHNIDDENNSTEQLRDLVDLVQSKIHAYLDGLDPLRTDVTCRVTMGFDKLGDIPVHFARVEFQAESEETL